MKTAITITIDIECAMFIKSNGQKASRFINRLILDAMKADLDKKKRLKCRCVDCHWVGYSGDTCYCDETIWHPDDEDLQKNYSAGLI